jgi:hypothetical protein
MPFNDKRMRSSQLPSGADFTAAETALEACTGL